MDWLGIQALAFGREVGELRFDSDPFAEETGLTVKLIRFRIEGKDWFDRAGQQAIYLPGQSFSVETSHFIGLLFNLCPPGRTTSAPFGKRPPEPCSASRHRFRPSRCAFSSRS